jgi:hypothetical protein
MGSALRILDNRSRALVDAHAVRMKDALADNQSKGGWDRSTYNWLFREAESHLFALKRIIEGNGPSMDAEGEAADVSNFCMMIADNYRRDRETARKGD